MKRRKSWLRILGLTRNRLLPLPCPSRNMPYIRQFREDEMMCFRVLTDYLHLLEDWKVRYAPKTSDDALDDRFVEACQMLDYIEYLADILTVGNLEERVAVVDELMKEGKVAFLRDYVARKRKEGGVLWGRKVKCRI